MAYSLIYIAEFDSLSGQANTVEIYKKDYSGDPSEITCGGGAVKHNWGPDERNPPVKGSSLEINLLNIEGTFPITNLYSNEDDTFKVLYKVEGAVKFAGFIIYDDCSEVQDDFTHDIAISCGDGLGLLKDVALNQSAKTLAFFATYAAETFNFGSPNTLYATGLATIIQVGDRIVISGSSSYGTYNIIGINPISFSIAETVISTFADTGDITIYRSNLQGRFSLANIIKFALAPTMLELNLHAYNRIRPIGGTTARWLDDTYVDAGTWLQNEKYEDCEKVLRDILEAWKCTLLQANGLWNIVRWNELRYFYGVLLRYEYDADMAYIDDDVLPDPVTIGTVSDIETGLIASLIRPYKFTRETFKYRQQTNILRNADFQKLGPLINEYTDGTDTVSEYEMADWEQGFEWTTGGNGYIGSTAQRFIRVRTNSVDEEVSRIGVIKGTNGYFDQRSAAQSYPVEVRAGDRIKISWEWKTTRSQAGPGSVYFIVHILTTLNPVPRAATNKYLNLSGEWRSIPYFGADGLTIRSYIPTGGNSNEWQSVSVDSKEIPVDGLLTFKLAQNNQNPPGTDETHYRNIRFEIFRSIAGSTTVDGHIHTQTQQPVINNAYDEEIFLDDTQSSAIAGALLLSTFTGPLQNLTTLWNIPGSGADRKLGQIITLDLLMAAFKTRTKLDGTILRSDLTPLSVILYSGMPGKNFVPGQMEIDYKQDLTTLTLYEQYEDGEDDADLIENYDFRYIYKTN